MILITKRWLAISALSGAALGACGPGSGVYCQSGSKYGTQCYSEADVKNDPNQRGTEREPRKGEPPNTPPPNQVRW